jgi:hypothetical protein
MYLIDLADNIFYAKMALRYKISKHDSMNTACISKRETTFLALLTFLYRIPDLIYIKNIWTASQE